MSEHMSPIPSRIYNAAVGGHVAGADQIIDDETGLTLDKVAGGALEAKEYTSGSDNGMGRVVLRKNLVEGVNTLTQSMINKSNTIYVIQYDFILAEDITIPTNCVLAFDGGSINGEHFLTGNNTGIQAELVKIFNTDVTFNGDWNVVEIYPEWFGAVSDGVTDDTLAINCSSHQGHDICSRLVFTKKYRIDGVVGFLSNSDIEIRGTIYCSNFGQLCVYNEEEDNPGWTGRHDVYIHGNGFLYAINIPLNAGVMISLYHTNNCTIEGLTFKNQGRHSIEIEGNSNIVVRGCKFTGQSTLIYGDNDVIQIGWAGEQNGVRAFPYDNTGSKNIVIEKCIFVPDEGYDFITCIGNHAGYYGHADTIIIRDNYFLHNKEGLSITNPDGSVYRLGTIRFYRFTNNVIIENNVFLGAAVNIAMHQGEHYNTIIRDNSFLEKPFAVISISGGEGSNVYNTQICNNFFEWGPPSNDGACIGFVDEVHPIACKVANNHIKLTSWNCAFPIHQLGKPASYQSVYAENNVIEGIDKYDDSMKSAIRIQLNRFIYKGNLLKVSNNEFVSFIDPEGVFTLS